jgi:hypothetical protein
VDTDGGIKAAIWGGALAARHACVVCCKSNRYHSVILVCAVFSFVFFLPRPLGFSPPHGTAPAIIHILIDNASISLSICAILNLSLYFECASFESSAKRRCIAFVLLK